MLTITRSPTCSVFSIDPDGMKNAWTRNVLSRIASASATTIRIGSSRQMDPGGDGFLSVAACAGSSAGPDDARHGGGPLAVVVAGGSSTGRPAAALSSIVAERT